MKLSIALDDRDQAILVCDEDLNDIAEFYHSDHATVSQSYETALALAKQLVEGVGVCIAVTATQISSRRTAELEGRLAQQKGLPASANPYVCDGWVPSHLSDYWRTWEDGYRNESWQGISGPVPNRKTDPHCQICGRTDSEYLQTAWLCSDPWHGDAHLRKARPGVVGGPAT